MGPSVRSIAATTSSSRTHCALVACNLRFASACHHLNCLISRTCSVTFAPFIVLSTESLDLLPHLPPPHHLPPHLHLLLLVDQLWHLIDLWCCRFPSLTLRPTPFSLMKRSWPRSPTLTVSTRVISRYVPSSLSFRKTKRHVLTRCVWVVVVFF